MLFILFFDFLFSVLFFGKDCVFGGFLGVGFILLVCLFFGLFCCFERLGFGGILFISVEFFWFLCGFLFLLNILFLDGFKYLGLNLIFCFLKLIVIFLFLFIKIIRFFFLRN